MMVQVKEKNVYMKKNLKLINKLYDYSKSLDFLPPRGDGAKHCVAMEVHNLVLKLFNKLEKQNEKEQYETCLMLLELVEQMLLDKIDNELTVEEMMLYED